VFDISSTICHIIIVSTTKFWTFIITYLAVYNCLTLAMITVIIMCIERLIMFNAPYIYSRAFHLKRVQIVAFVFWTLFIGLDFVFIFVFLILPGTFLANVSEIHMVPLLQVRRIFLTLLVSGSTVVSLILYGQLYLVIRRERRRIAPIPTFVRGYRSTLTVLAHVTSNIIMCVLYAVIIWSMQLARGKYLVLGGLFAINSIFDALLYVAIFKECRYELLKVFVKCFPRLKPKAECMRRDVYDIVVIHNVPSTQSN